MEFRTSSEQETQEVGFRIGKALESGAVLCLDGDLGAGKTAFTRGLARALGIEGHITSPTFTIVNEYSGELPLYHFDVYRVGEVEEMYEIGFEEYLYGSGIVVIEWAGLIEDILPLELVRVEIRKDLNRGENERIISVHIKGERYKCLQEDLNENSCS